MKKFTQAKKLCQTMQKTSEKKSPSAMPAKTKKKSSL